MSSLTYGNNVPDEAVSALTLLLDAIGAGDHRAFLAPGTVGFQKGISPAMFESVSRQIASRLALGYRAAFLTELKQGELRTFLWKISFSDGGDEFIARLALTADGQVAGFLLN